MKNNADNRKIISIDQKKIKKNIETDVDPECQEIMKDFVNRFQDDTLTGK